ncbi:hypothetical protein OUZ56_032352 [Daphnia magna]|uniref:DNA polymerase Y family protein n=1 Tax=Daphnia magna TaxID=35525 RepID=A0ABR0B8M4_9CRUS|nr:hypothetical protein OUZ56_032352 [Daphnia magna]
MRIAAILFPELRSEIAYSSLSTLGPCAVVRTESAETTLLGNHLLAEVNRAAQRFGVRVGMTVAQARARLATLEVALVYEGRVREELARIAEHFLGFGATVSFRAGGEGPVRSRPPANLPATAARETAGPLQEGASTGAFFSVVHVDVTGCAGLHQADSPGLSGLSAEEILLTRLLARAEELGHQAFGAIADGPRVAEAFAQALVLAATHRLSLGRPEALKSRRVAQKSSEMIQQSSVIPPGHNALYLGELPVDVLPIRTETRRWFQKLGLKQLAAVRDLPRRELAHRLGGELIAVLPLLDGDDRAPLKAYNPPETPEESLEMEPILERHQLLFVARRLASAWRRALKGAPWLSQKRPFDFPSMHRWPPIYAESAIFDLIRAKIDAFDVPLPVVAMVLRAERLVPCVGQAISLFSAAREKARAGLAALVATLTAELEEDHPGDEAVGQVPASVGRLVLGDDYALAARTRMVPWDAQHAKTSKDFVVRPMAVPEPTRLLATPLPLAQFAERYGLKELPKPIRFLYRLAQVDWWRSEGAGGATDFLLLGGDGLRLLATTPAGRNAYVVLGIYD